MAGRISACFYRFEGFQTFFRIKKTNNLPYSRPESAVAPMILGVSSRPINSSESSQSWLVWIIRVFEGPENAECQNLGLARNPKLCFSKVVFDLYLDVEILLPASKGIYHLTPYTILVVPVGGKKQGYGKMANSNSQQDQRTGNHQGWRYSHLEVSVGSNSDRTP